jgi:hypothetical protein
VASSLLEFIRRFSLLALLTFAMMTGIASAQSPTFLRGDRMSQREVWVFCDCPGCPHEANISDVDGMNLWPPSSRLPIVGCG